MTLNFALNASICPKDGDFIASNFFCNISNCPFLVFDNSLIFFASIFFISGSLIFLSGILIFRKIYFYYVNYK